MRRKYTIAAAALLLVGAPAQAERAERDPDKMAVIAATILIFDGTVKKSRPSSRRLRELLPRLPASRKWRR
jgi:hypothetical protein